MFEKMSPREKKLAWAVGLLMPIGLLFVGGFWFLGKYDDNVGRINSLSSDVQSEQDRMDAGAKAAMRRKFFNGISMSPDIDNATQDYLAWLNQLCIEVGFDLKDAKPSDGKAVAFLGAEIGESQKFTVIADCDLGELTEFLTRFYSVEALHRIDELKIIPRNEMTKGKADQKIRTGVLAVTIKIEMLALTTAEVDRDFTQQIRTLTHTGEEYQQKILRRNVFGPANNTPSVDASIRNSYDSGTEVTVGLTGDDIDKNDVLTFTLIESPFDGVELKPTSKRHADLIFPGHKEGTYDFAVKVVDNGFPPKESIEKQSITFIDPEPDAPPVIRRDPPPFKHASQTRITGVSQGRDGKWLAWITVRLEVNRYRLHEGESFRLDNQDWFVDSIKPTEVVLRAGDKYFRGRPNARERGVLKEIPNPNPVIKTDAPDDKDDTESDILEDKAVG